MNVIRLPNNLVKRLEKYAQGFDTPVKVIERILDEYEQMKGIEVEPTAEIPELTSKPELVFVPSEDELKQNLVAGIGATVTLHYYDGETSEGTWSPSRFTEQSNLRANIWSGYLRGWKDKGIVKAVFESQV
ncbi:MAG: hypothetical protein PSN46_07245 [Gammaproteobacteria bacterium]|nr:hypothetical protein [Gammaproteobacteria bacterium]